MDNLDDILENIERDHGVKLLHPKRYIRDQSNPFEFYYEEAFIRRFKFSKEIVLNLLLPLVIEDLQRPNNRGLPVPPAYEILIGLRFFASASYQSVVGDTVQFSQSTVCSCIHRVANAFARKLGDFIHFPENDEDQKRNIKQFYEIAGFPNVAACIDGCLIKIASPGKDIAEIFRCRKGWFAINVMAAVGPRGEFLFLDVRHPGSTHDQTCFDRSALKLYFDENRYRGLILGDNGYGNETYLLTPFVTPANRAEKRYNKSHKKTRNLIERSFGRWKAKFSCLKRGLLNHTDNIIPIICACGVLWNVHIHVNYPNDLNNQNYENAEYLEENPPRHQNALDYRLNFVIRHFLH